MTCSRSPEPGSSAWNGFECAAQQLFHRCLLLKVMTVILPATRAQLVSTFNSSKMCLFFIGILTFFLFFFSAMFLLVIKEIVFVSYKFPHCHFGEEASGIM